MKSIIGLLPVDCGSINFDGRQDRNDVGIILLPDGSHLSIAIFLQKSKEEKEVAEIAEQCLMRVQADDFLRNMPPDLQMP